jgi:flagellar basal-body rod protein FlgB
MISRLTESLDFHAQALSLRAERQRIIASNIANADTPGYQARDFDFATALRNATGSAGGATGSGIGSNIASGVMSPGGPGGRAQPTLRYAVPAQTNLDSNSVDMDRERAAFADNSVKYESTLRFINGSVRTMLDSMKSHTQG